MKRTFTDYILEDIRPKVANTTEAVASSVLQVMAQKMVSFSIPQGYGPRHIYLHDAVYEIVMQRVADKLLNRKSRTRKIVGEARTRAILSVMDREMHKQGLPKLGSRKLSVVIDDYVRGKHG